jgi:hypothetical protein
MTSEPPLPLNHNTLGPTTLLWWLLHKVYKRNAHSPRSLHPARPLFHKKSRSAGPLALSSLRHTAWQLSVTRLTEPAIPDPSFAIRFFFSLNHFRSFFSKQANCGMAGSRAWIPFSQMSHRQITGASLYADGHMRCVTATHAQLKNVHAGEDSTADTNAWIAGGKVRAL